MEASHLEEEIASNKNNNDDDRDGALAEADSDKLPE